MKLAVDKDIPYLDSFLEILANEYKWDIIKFSDSYIVKSFIKNCDAIFIRSTLNINDELIHKSKIRYIGSATSGYDHIDTDLINWDSSEKKCFIAKGCNSDAVVNYVLSAIAFLISNKQFSVSDSVGIIGYGRIGSLLKQKLDMFNIRSSFFDPYINTNDNDSENKLKRILNCDLVSLHCSHSKTGEFPSHNLINEKTMKHANLNFLINSSRGEVVDEEYILNQTIFKYIADVWFNEPVCSKKNINDAYLSTPHIAGYSIQAKKNASLGLINSFCNFFNIEIFSNEVDPIINIYEKDISKIDLFENKFPCEFFKNLFDIEACSDDFKIRHLKYNEEFSNIRRSFKYTNDYSIFNLAQLAKKFN